MHLVSADKRLLNLRHLLMIPRLLDFENMFDGALGAFDKASPPASSTNQRSGKCGTASSTTSSISVPPRSTSTRNEYHSSLPSLHEVQHQDLIIFSLLNMNNRKILEFFKVLDALRSDNARIRIDTCRLFHILVSHIPGSAISSNPQLFTSSAHSSTTSHGRLKCTSIDNKWTVLFK